MNKTNFSLSIPNVFRDYVLDIHKNIKGGTRVTSFEPLLLIFNFQQIYQIFGSIGELGVKDGRFFIGVQNLKRAGEKTFAIDIFDEQTFNSDGSGKRNEKTPVAFFENVDKYAFEPEMMSYMKKDSLDMNLSDILNILQNKGTFRFFSIDGGHTAEHTFNDLKIAEQLVHNTGIIALDDYLNSNWLGVHQGFAYYNLLYKPKFIPLMQSSNKLFLCNYTFRNKYFTYLRKIIENPEVKRRVKQYKIDTLYEKKILTIHFHPNALSEYLFEQKSLTKSNEIVE